MGEKFAITPFLTGDPIGLAPDVTSLSALLAALGLAGSPAPGFLPLAPGIALVHSLTGEGGRLALRWVQVAPPRVVVPGSEAVESVAVVTGAIADGTRGVRLAARLRAACRDPVVRERVVRATSREDLVHALAATDQSLAESPLSSEELFELLGSGPGGLGKDEARRRLALCGQNRLERVRRRSLLGRFLEQFTSFFALLLWVGGAFALLAGMPELGWAMFAVIVVNGVFSFLQEYRAERAVEALQELLPRAGGVARDGDAQRVPAVELVAGDVVVLEEGDQVPGDGQLVSAESLRVDQSALTGESHPVFKLPVVTDERERVPRFERHELVFAGTSVVSGRGRAVLIATGMATQIGEIARLTQDIVEEASPLQQEMARLTRVVTVLAVSFGIGFFVLGVAGGLLPLTDGFLFALGVIVANVPEGLLPTLTLALALGVTRMARQRTLVKRLSAVEALGGTTVICTDKTGTVTENRMTARALWVSGRSRAVPEAAGEEDGDVRALLEAAVLASHATIDHGDPTEVALATAAVAAGIDAETLRAARPVVATLAFDSFRKRMTLVRDADGETLAYVKGAPKETLALCTTIRSGAATVPLDGEARRAILRDHDRLAADGLRILAVAVRPLRCDLRSAPPSAIERDLTFLGLIALWDPPRAEVEAAVALCRRAGVRVIMITGDYGLTAHAIARRIGLHVDKVVTGEEVERLSPAALRGLLQEPGVLFARTSPAHKLSIVEALKALGEVVAVTGDGVNDAPALKAADIGVAMGKRGTDVAKEAAEVVITDDNFASIVSAIREGRGIYANMRKFVTYIFASNVPELVPFLAFVFLRIPLPLTVMQILAVDLGTDLLPALALGAEPPEPGVMDRPPRARGERLLGAGRLAHAYAFLGAAEAVLAMAAFFWTYWLAGWRPGAVMAAGGALYRRATTMTLAGIVAAQVGNVFACRTERASIFQVGLASNLLVLAGVVAEVAILVGLIAIPPLRHVFGLAPLGVAEWSVLLLFPPAMLALDEGRKCILRRGGR